jgi:hypothetical protein
VWEMNICAVSLLRFSSRHVSLASSLVLASVLASGMFSTATDRRNGSWIKHTMDFAMIDVHKIQVGDMDKNGTLDILAVEQDQSPLDRVAVFYNDGKGNLTEQVISNAKGHNDPIGDVIGNGSLDILNSGHGYFNDSHPLQIFLNPY